MLYFCTKCNSQGVDSLLLCAQELNDLFFPTACNRWYRIDIEHYIYRCASAVKMRIAIAIYTDNKTALSNSQYIANKEFY